VLKPILKKILPQPVIDWLRPPPPPFNLSYSQEGEDMVLRRIFEMQPTGFYVDIGAHHPERFSNTNFFYQRGWRGINVDAMPGSMEAFGHLRPEDANLQAAVSDQSQTLTYFIFDERALNSFDRELSLQRQQQGCKILQQVEIKTITLADLLEKHLPPGRQIDFLSVDVEGFDLNVLRSNNWERFRPRVILVEDMTVSAWGQINGSPTTEFLRSNGYEPFASTLHTIFYRRPDGEKTT
jgi:FkbM family methyltransferase